MGGAVTFQKRLGPTPTGKASERRIRVTFPTVNAPVVAFHGLGRVPTSFTPVAPYAAGTVYCDFPMRADRRTIVLKCSVAGVTCDLIVR